MNREQKSRLGRVDHITYAVKDIRKWAWWYVERCRGALITRVDDVDPDGPSSMMLWCIRFSCEDGEKPFGIALVQGIDRTQKSQVTAFIERHGDHSVQHVAFDVGDFNAFTEEMVRTAGLKFRGDTLTRDDGFGEVTQVFSKAHDPALPVAEAMFTEFVVRPERPPEKTGGRVTFSGDFGTKLYRQVEAAREQKDAECMIDFSFMPPDWEPPEPVQ